MEDVADQLTETRQLVKDLAARVRWLQHHIRTADRMEPANLDGATTSTVQAKAIRASDSARAAWLSDSQRWELDRRINVYEATCRTQQHHLAAALQHSKSVAEGPHGHAARTKAAAMFRHEREQYAKFTNLAAGQRDAFDDARAQLAADDQRRAASQRIVRTAERARLALRTEMRAKIAEAISNRAAASMVHRHLWL